MAVYPTNTPPANKQRGPTPAADLPADVVRLIEGYVKRIRGHDYYGQLHHYIGFKADLSRLLGRHGGSDTAKTYNRAVALFIREARI